jgi:hypothetical protein
MIETRLYVDRPSRRTVHASTDVILSMPFVAQLSLASRRRTASSDDAEIVQDLAATLERSSQNDEAFVDQGIPKARMLLPAVLLSEIARPIPRTPRCTNDEEHDKRLGRRHRRGGAPIDFQHRRLAQAGVRWALGYATTPRPIPDAPIRRPRRALSHPL